MYLGTIIHFLENISKQIISNTVNNNLYFKKPTGNCLIIKTDNINKITKP